MTIKFINARILIMDNDCKIIKNGCLTVESGIITYCGNKTAEGVFDRIIDVKGDILMPGLVNCHSHLGMSLFRNTAEGTTLDDWLYKQIFPMESKLTEEDVYFGTMLSVAECVRGGITTVADSYYHNIAGVQAALNSGINMVLLGADMDIKKSSDVVLNNIYKDYEQYNGKYKNISYIPGCHSVYTCSKKLIEGIADFASSVKSKTYIHLSETLKEVGDCTNENNGLTPPQYLHKSGYFDYGGVAAHCVYVDKDDISLLKQSDVSVVHCPASNLKLGSGIAPVYSMIEQDLNVALGTDSSASNNRLDLFREMYLSSALQKGVMNNADAIPAEIALKMATSNGCKALNLKNTGILKKGYNADIIRISKKEPHFYPYSEDIAGSLVYSAISSDVIMTMCQGKIVYENGIYNLGTDLETIFKECDTRSKRLKN